MSDGCAIKLKILGDVPGKPLLIAHHGASGLCTHKEPAAQFGAFADTFRVLVFDSRGSGNSDKKRPYTHQRWTQDIEELRYQHQRLIDQKTPAEPIFQAVGRRRDIRPDRRLARRFPDYRVHHSLPQHLYGAIMGDAGAQWVHWGQMSALKAALTDPRVKPDPE
jgi:proline iminopeptidase